MEKGVWKQLLAQFILYLSYLTLFPLFVFKGKKKICATKNCGNPSMSSECFHRNPRKICEFRGKCQATKKILKKERLSGVGCWFRHSHSFMLLFISPNYYTFPPFSSKQNPKIRFVISKKLLNPLYILITGIFISVWRWISIM